jgi:hypothetical protein
VHGVVAFSLVSLGRSVLRTLRGTDRTKAGLKIAQGLTYLAQSAPAGPARLMPGSKTALNVHKLNPTCQVAAPA